MPVRSIHDVVKSGMPSIAEVSRNYGIEITQSVLTLAVSDLIKSLNVGKTMDVNQKVQAVNMMIESYPFMTLADIKLFFFRFKRGDFGKQYDRLDVQVIMQAWEQYFGEKTEIVLELNDNAHINNRKQESEGFHPDVIAAIKSAIGDKKPTEKPPVERVRTPQEVIFQRWIKQFNNLFKKYGIDASIRAIRIGGRVFDLTEFLNQKSLNYEKMDR